MAENVDAYSVYFKRSTMNRNCLWKRVRTRRGFERDLSGEVDQ